MAADLRTRFETCSTGRLIGILASCGMQLSVAQIAIAQKPPCSAETIAAICAEANDDSSSIEINCSVDFNTLGCELATGDDNFITKKLIFEGDRATNVVFDCAGGRIYAGPDSYNYRRRDIIEVRSELVEGTWVRPENVTIRNCDITGSVRLIGMGANGEAEPIRDSSDEPGHVERIRSAAPTNIVLEAVKIVGTGRNPLYFAPGVTRSKLLNSEVTGVSSKVGIYLDAESSGNVLRDNRIHVDTEDGSVAGFYDRGWPQIAVDASSGNEIVNNHFSSLNEGGIYLYRNCGEGGTVRHTTPSRNVIVNNIFYYNRYKGREPAVFLGSRDYGWIESVFGHCGDDNMDDPVGSAASNADHATHNVVMQNQLYRRKIWSTFLGVPYVRDARVEDMIRSRNWSNNSPNFIDHNELVTDETVDEDRRAGCYLPATDQFLEHGTSEELIEDRGVDRACYSLFECDDGNSGRSRVRDCRIHREDFSCRVEGDNAGCEDIVRCPAGQRILGARAACNLEFGEVRGTSVGDLGFDRLAVVRESDNRDDGECWVGFNRISSGESDIRFIRTFPSVGYGCKERDSNGGDCHIRGSLYCQR